MPRVFISHSSKDLDFIRTQLQPILDELGMVAWCSATDMRIAADWERQIRVALAQADWFMVVMSPDAQTSDWVQAETHWALEHKRGRVIPLMVRSCTPEEIHLKLGKLQFIDYRRDPAAAAARLRALIGEPASNAITRITAPTLMLDSCDATVIRERLAAEVLLFIEPDSQPGYEQRLRIQSAATIGRMEGVDLCLPDGCISRRHARLSVSRSSSGPVLTLADLDSANGTYVNRERLIASRCLAVGDLIELGNVRLLVRDIEYQS